jgi:hypothetical protein
MNKESIEIGYASLQGKQRDRDTRDGTYSRIRHKNMRQKRHEIRDSSEVEEKGKGKAVLNEMQNAVSSTFHKLRV